MHAQLWEDLVAAALLGTERRPVPPLDLAGPLGQALRGLSPEPEARLLQAGGVLALYRTAGRQPARDTGPAEELAPADPRPPAPPRALPRDLVPEWLDLIVRTGRRAPDELLPPLLDLAREDPRQHPRVMAAGGPRAAWLARLRPEWDPADDAETFATRPLAQRAAALRRMRWRDPAAAREALAAVWAEEPSPARILLLKALEVRLGPEDEPFLTAALSDRRKEVRTEAAALLLRLPESQPSRDLWESARPLLRFEDGKLQAHPPASTPPVSGPRGKLGERAWWLRDTLALVPPSRWGSAELVPAALATDWSQPLLEGWALGAAAFPDRGWAEALLPHLSDLDLARRVVAALPHADREALVTDARLLPACTHAWSAAFSRRWKDLPPGALRDIVARLHPSVLGEVRTEGLAREALDLRIRMRRELLG